MNDASLKPMIANLESLFSKFNDLFYDGELQSPVITISPDTTRGAYGWCTSGKVWKNQDTGFYEINMCAEYMTRSVRESLRHCFMKWPISIMHKRELRIQAVLELITIRDSRKQLKSMDYM